MCERFLLQLRWRNIISSFSSVVGKERESEEFIAILFSKEKTSMRMNEHILRSFSASQPRNSRCLFYKVNIFHIFPRPLKNINLGFSLAHPHLSQRHKVILFWIKIASRVTNIWRLTRSSGDEMQNDSLPFFSSVRCDAMWKCVDVLTQFGKLDTLGLFVKRKDDTTNWLWLQFALLWQRGANTSWIIILSLNA